MTALIFHITTRIDMLSIISRLLEFCSMLKYCEKNYEAFKKLANKPRNIAYGDGRGNADSILGLGCSVK